MVTPQFGCRTGQLRLDPKIFSISGSKRRQESTAAQIASAKSFCSRDERLGVGVRRDVMSDVTVLQWRTRAATNQGRGYLRSFHLQTRSTVRLVVSRMLGEREVGPVDALLGMRKWFWHHNGDL
jgi:hypothetical protein